MKKRFIALALTAAMLAAPTSVFAALEDYNVVTNA